MIEFTAFPKIPRLFRDTIVTEKIDGTNAAVVIGRVSPNDTAPGAPGMGYVRVADPEGIADYVVCAQSRSRFLTVHADNFGFGSWVWDHAEALTALGEGTHFGEWWGHGIQRGYGAVKGQRAFSLFDTERYVDLGLPTTLESDGTSDLAAAGVRIVPILNVGTFDTWTVENALEDLGRKGSTAAPGYMHPEGVIVRHIAARQTFKVLLENDNQPKGQNR